MTDMGALAFLKSDPPKTDPRTEGWDENQNTQTFKTKMFPP